MLHDTRFALRSFRKSPGFTFAVVFMLGLAIAGNVAVFGIVRAVLAAAVPFADADRVVELGVSSRAGGVSLPDRVLLDALATSRAFDHAGGFAFERFNLSDPGREEPEHVRAAHVTRGFFESLGVRPILGRAFLPAEFESGRNRVVLLSHQVWQARYLGSRDVVGKAVRLNGIPYAVAGVLPRHFDYAVRRQIWLPLAEGPASSTGLALVAHLRGDVSKPQAQSELDRLAASLVAERPELGKDLRFEMYPAAHWQLPELRLMLLLVASAASLVLLIACANVANLLLARGSARQREIALRASLGASRARLTRQLLVEGLLLSLAAGIAGLALARSLANPLLSLFPDAWVLPVVDHVDFDLRMFAFTAGACILTALLFSLTPMFSLLGGDLNKSLRDSGRGLTAGGTRRRLRNLLVAGEVALSVVLLFGAGLLLKSLWELRSIPMGFRPAGILSMQFYLPRHYDIARASRFYEALLQRLGDRSEIDSASLVTDLPLNFSGSSRRAVTDAPSPVAVSIGYQAISPDYFRVMGIPLLRGRTFTRADDAGAAPVAILSEPGARRLFGSEDAIGRHLILRGARSTPQGRQDLRMQVIGMVGGVRHNGPMENLREELYVPHVQNPAISVSFVLRTNGDPMLAADMVRNEVSAIDKDQAVYKIRTAQRYVDESTGQERFKATLIAIFGAIAILLAAAGVYAVISHSVNQRVPEIGVRIALGARRPDILRLVIADGLRMTLGGLVFGVAGALGAGRLLAHWLFRVRPFDAMTLAAVVLLVLLVAAIACLAPASRAIAVGPSEALRQE